MGGVAIFSMHYVANRAIVLYAGQEQFQLAYNTGYTILSLFLPILVLILAFILVGVGDFTKLWRIMIAGVFGGLAIAGMHYVGQLSVVNYSTTYSAGYVVGAVSHYLRQDCDITWLIPFQGNYCSRSNQRRSSYLLPHA